MKNKRIAIAIALVALAILATFGIFRNTKPVQAQDVPPPVNDRISFGMVGLTAGQTLRLSVSNTIMPNDANFPPGPTRVVLNFRLPNGQLLRNRNGEVIRRTIDLERGDSTFLDVDFGALPPPVNDRLQLRAVVVVHPPPVGDNNTLQDGVCIPTVEVINNAAGRTVFVMSKEPAYRKIQPPPIGE